MQAQTTNPKPARQDLLAAWAAYEQAQAAAEAGGWEYDLSMAAAAAYAAWDKLNEDNGQMVFWDAECSGVCGV